nr:SDR family NAD(P)-dependent oxidoreductase [Streptomyces durhamensis]
MVDAPDKTLRDKVAFVGGASRNLGGLISATLGAGGKIITIVTSLLAAYTGLYSCYAGSKAPVEHFTRALSKELFGRNISVNNIAP